MFKCGKQVGPNVKQRMQVTERRERSYPEVTDKQGNVPEGWEIVSEVPVCPKCAK